MSIDGETHQLPTPFIVLATDNPIEYEGTYPLPEAQLDRFAIRLELRYLSERDETSMLRRRLDRGSAEPTVNQVVDAHDLLAMRESVEQVTVHEDVLHYVVSLATATRHHPQVAVGASPRAELDLVQLARARALLLGRDYVIPEDVKALAVPAWRTGSPCGRRCGCDKIQGSDVVEELLRRLPVPRTHGGPSERRACDRDPRSRVALACITIDAGDRDLRRGGAGRRRDRCALAADRVRGAAARRAVLDQLAAPGAEDPRARANPVRSDASKPSRRR